MGTTTHSKQKAMPLLYRYTIPTHVEPAVFNLFVEWLYTQQLPTNYFDYIRIANVGFGETSIEDIWKIKLYVLADRFAVSTLRTAMSRQIVNDSDFASPKVWSYTPVIYAFNNSSSTDPLLDLFVDRYYMERTSPRDVAAVENLAMVDNPPRDFLLRFYKRVAVNVPEHMLSHRKSSTWTFVAIMMRTRRVVLINQGYSLVGLG